jgi:hypothetical protein
MLHGSVSACLVCQASRLSQFRMYQSIETVRSEREHFPSPLTNIDFVHHLYLTSGVLSQCLSRSGTERYYQSIPVTVMKHEGFPN